MSLLAMRISRDEIAERVWDDLVQRFFAIRAKGTG